MTTDGGKEIFEVRGVSKSFGSVRALRNVSFTLQPSTITGLIGPSGSGKSALLKILGRVTAPDSGSFQMGGIRPEEIGLMFQEGALFDSISVFDNVAFPLVHGRVPTSSLPRRRQLELYKKVMHVLSRVGLSDAIYKMPAQLSGGMRRRVSLARALVARPKLVLLDDPTSGLDPVASSVIMNLIIELQREYRPTVIIVSHDLRRLLPAVDAIIALFDGRTIFEGSLDELKAGAPAELCDFVSCRYDLNGCAAAS